MKPSKVQVFLAKSWPWNFAFWICSLCLGCGFAIPIYDMQKGFIAPILAGSFGGVIISRFMLAGCYRIITKMNGAPFHKGDVVQILVGEYQGHTATVYEEWRDRKQVRIDLGEQAKQHFKDVFSYNKICRVNQGVESVERAKNKNKQCSK